MTSISICAVSEKEAVTTRWTTAVIMIRILDPEQQPERILHEAFVVGKMHLFFHDIEGEEVLSEMTYKSFREKDAFRLLGFAVEQRRLQPKDVQWIIHCSAGVSRSVAVVHALRAFFDADSPVWTPPTGEFVNLHVLACMALTMKKWRPDMTEWVECAFEWIEMEYARRQRMREEQAVFCYE